MTEQERTRRLLASLQGAEHTIEQLGVSQGYPVIVGALMGMLENMVGVGPYEDGRFPQWGPSLFDPTVTEAIQSLLATIRGCLEPSADFPPASPGQGDEHLSAPR